MYNVHVYHRENYECPHLNLDCSAISHVYHTLCEALTLVKCLYFVNEHMGMRMILCEGRLSFCLKILGEGHKEECSQH